jgi:hypothetical protein
MAGVGGNVGRPPGLRPAAQPRPLRQRLARPGLPPGGAAAGEPPAVSGRAAAAAETEDDERVHGEQHLANHAGDRALAS